MEIILAVLAIVGLICLAAWNSNRKTKQTNRPFCENPHHRSYHHSVSNIKRNPYHKRRFGPPPPPKKTP